MPFTEDQKLSALLAGMSIVIVVGLFVWGIVS